MGKPKSLLPWGNRTLIEHQIRTLLQTEQPVVVILGAQAERIQPIASMYPVRVRVHEDWEAGMGSSISFGISRLTELFPSAAGALIAVIHDLPVVNTLIRMKTLVTNDNLSRLDDIQHEIDEQMDQLEAKYQ